MRRTHLVGMGLIAAACSTPSGTISLVIGADDPFTIAPVPTVLDIDGVNQDGGVTQLAQSALPTSTINLGGQGYNTVESVEAQGFDDAGAQVLWGEALPIQLGALEGTTLPIFVQRTDAFARMPNPFATAPASPLVTMLEGRFVLAAGAATASQATATQIYDLATWNALTSPPTLPIAPTSIAVIGTKALLVNPTQAAWYDFSDSSTSDVTIAASFSVGDIAGGATMTDPNSGDQYIVGATRGAGGATNAILAVSASKVDSNGLPTLTPETLTSARLGAAATWLNKSLVVYGGAGAGSAVNGVEELMGGASPSMGLFPPDATAGAGATAIGNAQVLIVGGLTSSDAGVGPAPTRLLDFNSCATSCVPDATSWPTPPIPLVSTQVFALSDKEAFVVGNEAGGQTHAFTIGTQTDAGATEIPFKVIRSGATAVRLPMGPIAVVGGDVTIESFAP